MIQAGDPDYDGYIDLTFVDVDGKQTTIERIDALAVKNKVDSLLPEEVKGTEFLDRVRKFVISEYGVAVNLGGASKFYSAIADYVIEMTKDFFVQGQNLPDSTASTLEHSQTQKSDTTTLVENKSEQENSLTSSQMNTSNPSTDSPTLSDSPS